MLRTLFVISELKELFFCYAPISYVRYFSYFDVLIIIFFHTTILQGKKVVSISK